MSILSILKYPDACLHRAGDLVECFDEALRGLARDMVDTMHAASGIGLAAPQVGRSVQLTVIDVSGGEDASQLRVLVNPQVVTEEGEVVDEEGCLSFPDLTLVVPRPQRVTVSAQDLEGERLLIEGEDLLARCLHHEIDHLQGVLFIDRVSPLKQDLAKRRIDRRIRAGDW